MSGFTDTLVDIGSGTGTISFNEGEFLEILDKQDTNHLLVKKSNGDIGSKYPHIAEVLDSDGSHIDSCPCIPFPN